MRASLLFFALFLVCAVNAHRCIHDEIRQPLSIVPQEDDYRLLAANVPRGPLRIQTDFSNLNSGAIGPNKTDLLVGRVMPDLVSFFGRLLAVDQAVAPLKVTLPTCQTFNIPAVFTTNGFSNADLLILVKADVNVNGVLAWASSCQSLTNGRPFVGVINFNPSYLDPTNYDYVMGVAKHELTHVLAFSVDLFPKFQKVPNLDPASASTPASPYIIVGAPIKVDPNAYNPVITKNLRTKNRGIYTGVNVLSIARKYFGCPSLDGVDIEDNGDPTGTAGSHWERRILGNEIMTGSTPDGRGPYSSFTLALLQDSGWYTPNYDLATPLTFGVNQGCSFLSDLCINKATGKSNFPSFFCTPSDNVYCNARNEATAYCSYGMLNGKASYDYFGNNYVGADTLADECPTVEAYGNGACNNASNADGNTAQYYGQIYAQGSYCAGQQFSWKYVSAPPTGGCFNMKCSNDASGNTRITITLADGQTILCPLGGGRFTVDPKSPLAKNWKGWIDCPKESVICNNPATVIKPN